MNMTILSTIEYSLFYIIFYKNNGLILVIEVCKFFALNPPILHF